ncbi:MAG TPA: hypothetical protein VEW48_07240 [Thermoanaerobaculia bacterium]|nr:hypothetical protein [Thermoanaerobaculia bacterium]
MSIPLDLVGSLLSFAGGVVLTVDAFLVRYNIRVEQGALQLREALERRQAGDVITSEAGDPLGSEKRLRLWLALRSLRRTQAGFALMTAGFLLDLFVRLAPKP